ncbi:SDR family oxidoreductase [Myxococcota bacterium]|nr:SDR family oxidoreductase [Myxococcota bacterium]
MTADDDLQLGGEPTPSALDPHELATTLRVLAAIADDRAHLAALPAETRRALIEAAGRVAKPEMGDKRRMAKALRKKDRDERRRADEALLESTGIRALRRAPIYPTPALPPPELGAALPSGEALDPGDDAAPEAQSHDAHDRPREPGTRRRLETPRSCYVCKAEFHELHFFYDSMCERCGDLNHQKRNQSCSLEGRTAIVTGARVKIGYHAAIKLLRAGAHVIVTTRFPRDAAERYAREPDFAVWRDRLSVYGLDLRHTPSVEAFTQHLLATLDGLDFIVNNACQTVRRPPGFYGHLLEAERAPTTTLAPDVHRLLTGYEALRGRALVAHEAHAAASAGLHDPAALSQLVLVAEDAANDAGIFPAGQLDADLQQVDLRTMNSWRLRLGEVSTVELLEVQLVNAVAPFVLNGKLRPLMARRKTFDKHIVNVSAMEGQFYRTFKTDKHPHTNMAKAALNMMTRTSAPDYARDGIYMNSVDTGWVTDEDPVVIAERKAAEQGSTFQPPLDIVDGAARILDPIFDGLITGEHRWGLFFKDYAPTPW